MEFKKSAPTAIRSIMDLPDGIAVSIMYLAIIGVNRLAAVESMIQTKAVIKPRLSGTVRP